MLEKEQECCPILGTNDVQSLQNYIQGFPKLSVVVANAIVFLDTSGLIICHQLLMLFFTAFLDTWSL